MVGCGGSSDDGTPGVPKPPTADVRGTWLNEVTVPPGDMEATELTLSGEEAAGTFVDQFEYTGTWSVNGNKITLVYEITGFENTFTGKISSDGQSMSGRNVGSFKEKEFKGSWEATRKP